MVGHDLVCGETLHGSAHNESQESLGGVKRPAEKAHDGRVFLYEAVRMPSHGMKKDRDVMFADLFEKGMDLRVIQSPVVMVGPYGYAATTPLADRTFEFTDRIGNVQERSHSKGDESLRKSTAHSPYGVVGYPADLRGFFANEYHQ
jgi:hypothetical protein